MSGDITSEGDVADLVKRAIAGDRAAWESLVGRFGGTIWAVARASGLSPTDAADVAQVVWLRLVENLTRLRDPGRLGAWLITTARNESLRVATLNQRVRPTEHRDIDRPDPRSAETSALALERERFLLRALDRLPHPCGLLLRLHIAEPAPPVAAVAEATGLPPAQVESWRRRCLGHLRRQLDDRGDPFRPRGAAP